MSHFVQCVHDPDLGFSQHRTGLHPGGEDIGLVDGIAELSIGIIAAVGDGIDLGEFWGFHVPVLGADRDVVFEQGPGFGPSIEAFSDQGFLLSQSSVDLAGADGEELPLEGRCQVESLTDPRKPPDQQGPQSE